MIFIEIDSASLLSAVDVSVASVCVVFLFFRSVLSFSILLYLSTPFVIFILFVLSVVSVIVVVC